jgi:16S rRNA (adenine1518-N6/adenine1519-N6)-dimethyltransferase
MARQRMGQHFLGNLHWRKRIAESLPLAANQMWIEIGAGHGEMTQLLAGDGRRVVAIEVDPPLASGLREKIAGHPSDWPGVDVVSANVLKTDLEKIAGGPFHVYGNLPYYITSPILHRLFLSVALIKSIHIVIQLEVAERIAAAPGRRDYGYLSVVSQFYTNPEIAFRVPPGAFRPPPKVDSALVHMTIPGAYATLKVADENRFIEFIASCFGQKRKTLRNNLLSVMPDEHIHAALADCGIRSDARAEQLSLAQFADLFQWSVS